VLVYSRRANLLRGQSTEPAFDGCLKNTRVNIMVDILHEKKKEKEKKFKFPAFLFIKNICHKVTQSTHEEGRISIIYY
jgi:hypothetical protein